MAPVSTAAACGIVQTAPVAALVDGAQYIKVPAPAVAHMVTLEAESSAGKRISQRHFPGEGVPKGEGADAFMQTTKSIPWRRFPGEKCSGMGGRVTSIACCRCGVNPNMANHKPENFKQRGVEYLRNCATPSFMSSPRSRVDTATQRK